MACGKPVVAGSEGASGELVRDGADGRVVPPANEEAIASALGSLLGDRERARIFGESARRRAEDLTPGRAAEATLQFWRKLRALDVRSHRP
jgi:glycosyltransferase involved in cell wall biosynthesis